MSGPRSGCLEERADGPLTLAEAGERVVRAARARSGAQRDADPELRGAVEWYAVASRSAGLPPQRLLIDLKQLLTSGALVHVDPRLRGLIVERAVRWAIHGYYSSQRPPLNPS